MRKQWKPFQSQYQMNAFSCSFECWQTLVFCKFVHFQGVLFLARVTFLIFTIATMFAMLCDSNKYNLTLLLLRLVDVAQLLTQLVTCIAGSQVQLIIGYVSMCLPCSCSAH